MQYGRELNKATMFYGASSLIMDRAKQLRRRMTEPEKLVWEIVRENAILGLKFRRQHPLNNYIADFYCHKIKLVIEIDGETHYREPAKLYDEHRTNVMNSLGIIVVRFSNEAVLSDLLSVKRTIEIQCRELLKI